jgi:hypothetical protein
LLLLSCLSLQAQSITEKIKLLVKKKTSVDSVYRFLGQQGFDVSENIIRPIDAGHDQLIAEYGESEIYNLLLQGDAAGIYLMVINRIDYTKTRNKKNILFEYDSARLQQFLSVHDSIYQTSTPIGLFKDFEVNRYGSACGFPGAPTPKFPAMMLFTKSNNTVSLRKWLQSPDYETKVLGATGLLILRQKKNRLTMEDMEITDHLKKPDMPINYCSGCTDWLPVSSVELLSNKQIAMYKNF